MPTNENVKYVGFTPTQINHGKKQLLYSELELLKGVEHFQKYKKLRKEEFAIKKLLKKALKELKEESLKIEDSLPKHVFKETEAATIGRGKQSRDTLQTEMDEIKRRIAALN